jgi:cytochrome c oxidase subunit 3
MKTKLPTATIGKLSDESVVDLTKGGGEWGDDDGFDPLDDNSDLRFKPDTYRVAMGLVLLIVLMTFGGLLASYVVLATNQTLEWRPFELPFQVWISTALIIVSSFDYELAKRSLLAGDQQRARKWFIITSVLGAVFIASQVLSWMNLVNLGYYATGNPFAGFFYILTAIHAVHVVGGVICLAYIVSKTSTLTDNENELNRRRWFATVVGWYWHFMGVLWIIIFMLLGLYK